MGTNFKKWREHVIIMLSCRDLDLAIQQNLLVPLLILVLLKKEHILKSGNVLTLPLLAFMIMKHTILEIIRGSIPEEEMLKSTLPKLQIILLKMKRLKQVPFLVTLFQCGIRVKET